LTLWGKEGPGEPIDRCKCQVRSSLLLWEWQKAGGGALGTEFSVSCSGTRGYVKRSFKSCYGEAPVWIWWGYGEARLRLARRRAKGSVKLNRFGFHLETHLRAPGPRDTRGSGGGEGYRWVPRTAYSAPGSHSLVAAAGSAGAWHIRQLTLCPETALLGEVVAYEFAKTHAG
jgi:hypothetical protein